MRRRFVQGPELPSAYTTVTNGARFAPLHTAASELFADFAANYACEVHDTFLEVVARRSVTHARAPITLVPTGVGAPLAVTFLAPFGIVLRCGWWYEDVFPSCSCDACDISSATEIERLVGLTRAVVAGGFQESLRIPLFGMAKQSHTFQSASSSSAGWAVVPRKIARQLRGTKPRESAWMPWEPKARAANVGAQRT